jgi:hypothetical protein
MDARGHQAGDTLDAARSSAAQYASKAQERAARGVQDVKDGASDQAQAVQQGVVGSTWDTIKQSVAGAKVGATVHGWVAGQSGRLLVPVV